MSGVSLQLSSKYQPYVHSQVHCYYFQLINLSAYMTYS